MLFRQIFDEKLQDRDEGLNGSKTVEGVAYVVRRRCIEFDAKRDVAWMA